jgi:ADP-ribose pyrophosphatase YjhB (NUDIX family)
MSNTQQKTKQMKNVAVAIITDETGRVLLIDSRKEEPEDSREEWDFPSNVIVPGATYTETFVSDILEETGCIIEAVSLVSSERKQSIGHHYEYVACKVVCRDNSYKRKKIEKHLWVSPKKVKRVIRRRINRDIVQHLGL